MVMPPTWQIMWALDGSRSCLTAMIIAASAGASEYCAMQTSGAVIETLSNGPACPGFAPANVPVQNWRGHCISGPSSSAPSSADTAPEQSVPTVGLEAENEPPNVYGATPKRGLTTVCHM